MAGLGVLLCLYLYTYHTDPAPNASIWALYPPMGTHVRNIGNVGAVVCVTALVMFLNRTFTKRLPDLLVTAGLFAAWTFLVWNGGRSSMAAALLTSMAVSLYSVVYAKASLKRVLAFVVLLVCATVLADRMSVFNWNGLQRTSHLITVTSTESAAVASEEFSAGRTTIWAMSINAFKTAPWFGLGPYGYFFIPERTDDDQPHNLVIQFLLEWGIVGTVPLLALMAYCAWQGLRQLPAAFRERDFGYVYGAAVILLLTVDGLTAGTYFKFQPMVCVCMAYAIFPFGRRHTIKANH
jgi:O-antigen ligase